MKKCIPSIILIHFIECLFIYSFVFLNAQAGWGPDQRLVFMQGGGWYPRAVCSGDTIHLVWWQAYTAHDEVFYKRSTDAGESWGPDVMLSVEDAQSSIMPIVGCTGSRVYVFWGEDDFGALLRISSDGGTTWGAIDSTSGLGGLSYQDMFVVYDTIFLAGARNPGDIIFRKSTDGGGSWLPLQVVGYGCYVGQAVNAPVIGHVYQVTRYTQEIMFKRSNDGGASWPDSVVVSDYDSIGSQRATIEVDTALDFHSIWYDYKYSPYAWTGDIFYRASRDSGNNWQPIDSLTIMHRAVRSDIIAEGNDLHLVWEDDRNDFGNNFEIYYRMSTDLGQTWGSEVRLTNALYHSYSPSFACGGEYLHLFWQDRRDYGNNGSSAPLYYKRKNLFVPVHEESKLSPVLQSGFDGHISPNPFSQTIVIMVHDTGSNDRLMFLRIFDISGKEMVCRVKERAQGRVEIDTSGLPCGVYFVKVEAGSESVIIKKVVKVK